MDTVGVNRLGAALESMLLEQCLAPLAKDGDPVASFGITSLAQSIAEQDKAGFGAALAAQLGDRVR